MMELIEIAPISVGILGNALGFSNYKSRIFSWGSGYGSYDFNHAVQVVGYNLDEGYYIIKNSWGTSWG